MCSVSFSTFNNRYNPNFTSNKKQSNHADDFIKELKKAEKRDTEGNWFNKYNNFTANIPYFFAIGTSLALLMKMKKSRKTLPIDVAIQKTQKYLKCIVLSLLGTICLSFGLNKYFDSKTNENYEKVSKWYSQANTKTDAVLFDKPICSNYIGALYSPISGVISVNKMYVNDPITRRKTKKTIKHELVHAKQYETVARSKDGIKKINFAAMNTIKRCILQNPIVADEFENIYFDIKNNPDKYKNTKIKIDSGSAEVNLTKYIEAIHILLNNPNASINDIPMVINTAHYQKVIDKKGALTPKEEAKADRYYQAMLNYQPANILNIYNPFGSYRQNLLEKEAYKENPDFISRLSNLVN